MAILAIVTGNITKSQYDSLRKEVSWEKNQPAGVILHVASFDERDRIHGADVWDSEQAMAAFFENHLIPAMKKLGIAQPESSVFPAYNINAYKGIEKHRI